MDEWMDGFNPLNYHPGLSRSIDRHLHANTTMDYLCLDANHPTPQSMMMLMPNRGGLVDDE